MGLIIKGVPKDEIACKRLYLSGTKAISNCPKCNQKTILDFSNEYLSNPVMNESFMLPFYCPECNTEWEHKVKLTVSLTSEEQ